MLGVKVHEDEEDFWAVQLPGFPVPTYISSLGDPGNIIVHGESSNEKEPRAPVF